MEVPDGESVAQILRRDKWLPWKRALRIARHALRSLQEAHAAGFVHRDVKADQLIVVTEDGDPDFTRVRDLRLAEPLDEPALSLEIRGDLRSLSMVLFEMLTGVKAATTGAQEAPRFADVAPRVKIPAAVEQLVHDGLAERFATAETFATRIEAVLDEPLDGRYRLEDELGRGTWGRVVRATHLGIGRQVAVKLLERRLLAEEDAGRRFEREAQAAGQLRHPNCVAVTDYGSTPDGGRYLVMELADGVRLDVALDQAGRMPVRRAVHILRHILRGLVHAHGLGLVHRDLKPPNIVLCTQGSDRDFARVLDFGLARMMAGDDRITRDGVVCGTPRYMAPEQALDRGFDARTDLYAASVILFEMLAGQTPFDGNGPAELIAAHVKQPVPRIADIAPGVVVADALEELLRRGLAKDPDDRPATAEEYLDALDRVCRADPTMELSVDDAEAVAPPPTPVRRRRLGIATKVAAIVAVGAIAAVEIWSSTMSSEPPAPTPPLVIAPVEAPPIDPEIAAALAVAANGQGEAATKTLRALRRRRPHDARIPYELGRIYMKLRWPARAIEAYRAAVQLDAAYRTDPELIGDVVALLGSKLAWQAAATALEKDIGAPALQALTEAANNHKDAVVRTRATSLLQKIGP